MAERASNRFHRPTKPVSPASESSAGSLVAARGLRAGYGKSEIVRGLDLEVRPGQVVALLGPNGAGKTTTLRTLSGDLPALGGSVLLNGSVTRAPLSRRARSGMGFVSQERAVLMRLSVAENFRVARCDRALALSLFPDLADHLTRKVGQLSGGQQQMVALAKALARSPKVLLADELSLGLAPIIVDQLLAEVRRAADRGVGVLLVEQHVRKVLAVADYVYVMRNGEIALSGSGADLRGRLNEVQEAYFRNS